MHRRLRSVESELFCLCRGSPENMFPKVCINREKGSDREMEVTRAWNGQRSSKAIKDRRSLCVQNTIIVVVRVGVSVSHAGVNSRQSPREIYQAARWDRVGDSRDEVQPVDQENKTLEVEGAGAERTVPSSERSKDAVGRSETLRRKTGGTSIGKSSNVPGKICSARRNAGSKGERRRRRLLLSHPDYRVAARSSFDTSIAAALPPLCLTPPQCLPPPYLA